MADQSRFWQRRTSRRRALQGSAIGAAGLAAASLIGCAPAREAAPPEQAAVKQPKRGGTLVFPSPDTGIYAAGIDPHIIGNSESGHMGFMYQNLVRRNVNTFDVESELAQRWEQPAPSEYVFRLAPGVKWHNKAPANGRDFTAEDVIFSLNRLGDSDPRFVNKALVANVDKVQAVDKSTVKITTRVPDVSMLGNLADWSALMLAPEVVERNPKITTADAVVGTGPFILQTIDDTSATLVRNPDYWKPGMPYLDGVRLAFIRDQQARWQAFLTGQMDVAPVPGTESKKFLEEQSKNYFTGWFKDAAIQNVWMNTTKKPFDDARVVKAMRLLIDHQEFITGWADVWWGPGLPNVVVSHFPHTMDSWDLSQDEYKALLEWKQPKDEAAREALRLLGAAGISRDNPLKFAIRNNDSATSGQTMAQLLQAQYARLGQGAVQTELALTDNTALSTTLARGEFDVAGPSARGSYFDPEEVLRNIYHSKGGRNFGKYVDSTIDDMIDRQRGAFDIAQRKPLVKSILNYLIDKAPYVGPCSRDQLTAAQAKVQNLAPIFFTGVYAFQMEQVWLDT